MSSRHLARLARAQGLDPLLRNHIDHGDEEDEEEDEEEEVVTQSKRTVMSLAALQDSSDSSDEDSEEEECNTPISENSEPLIGGLSSSEERVLDVDSRTMSVEAVEESTIREEALKVEKEDDDEFLDTIISQLKATGGNVDRDASVGESQLLQLLRCDNRNLKIEYEMRRKFGASVDEGARSDQGPGQGRGRGKRRGLPRGLTPISALALKKLVVSSPKEDWPKPPSFVGGGIGMSRVMAPANLPPWQMKAHDGAEWFCFKHSTSYEQLQVRFREIQQMHDPNNLAIFASQNPYHAEALLQLGMVFAHTGQMDRASEFVGRSLFALESAFAEHFRPNEGACRLDASIPANKPYLAALFRHMQMAGMVGCPHTALEVGRLLLSLDPLGDPMGCLLALDYFALATKQGEFLVSLFQSQLPVGFSSDDIARGCGRTDPNGNLHVHGDEAKEGKDDEGQAVATVQDLPGLSYSVGLALLDIGDVGAAREAMASALLRFPAILEPLLEKCGLSPRSTTHPYNWRSVIQHPHFSGALCRLGGDGHVLVHLGRIYVEKAGEIWKHERAQELLYDGAGIALQGLGPMLSTGDATAGDNGCHQFVCAPAEIEILKRAYQPNSPLTKYLDMALSDFSESFPTLPANANALDPRLMGANFMNQRLARVRLPGMRGGRRNGEEGGALVNMANLMEQLRQNEVAEDVQGRAAGRGGVGSGNLDPALPLAQLFWQTLLPWNSFSTPRNPVPPLPPGFF
ncbi:unnamed protein product [Choristocarpus tenellus]